MSDWEGPLPGEDGYGGGGAPRPAGRVPPHNLDAEASLLGAMLLSTDAIASALETVSVDDFYKPAHAHVFDAIVTLHARGEPADPITVAEELKRAGLLDSVGGPGALAELEALTPATSNAAHYARIIEERALMRKLIGVGHEVSQLGYDVPDDVTKAVDHAESLVFQVAQRRVTDTLLPIGDLMEAGLDRLEHLYERGDAITGTPTGYHELDQLLAGLQPSSLVIVGARPATGKTSLALGMVANAALKARKPVLLFSLEMSHTELTQRLICSEGGIDSRRIRTGQLSDEDWKRISRAVSLLAESSIWIDDNPNLTVMELRAKARRLKSQVGDLGMIVIDYLQLMTGRSNAESRQVEVSEISRGLKILARELECPVVALSQLSRQLEARQDKRPTLADLRESGCLTADTRIARADTGEEVTLGELLEQGARDIPVWTLDERMQLVPGRMTHVFPSGTKRVYELRLASGRSVKASANHPFLEFGGWTPVEQLGIGDRIAVATRIPAPRCEPALVGGSSHSGGAPVSWRTEEDSQNERLAESDVLWDRIVAITDLGEQPVFDATVPVTHNFLANGIVAHNSLEQDSDVVLFIYRDALYDREKADDGDTELIVAKHRNGPTGVVHLTFLPRFARFENMSRRM